MANKIQLKRGAKSNLTTLSAGEPAFLTDTRELFIGTGSANINMSGSQWYTGTAMSGTSGSAGAHSYSSCPNVKVGDIYLNTSYGYYYQCVTAGSGTSAKWTYKGTLKGSSGNNGRDGKNGVLAETIDGYMINNDEDLLVTSNPQNNAIYFFKMPSDGIYSGNSVVFDPDGQYFNVYKGTASDTLKKGKSYFIKTTYEGTLPNEVDLYYGKCYILAEGTGDTPIELMLNSL